MFMWFARFVLKRAYVEVRWHGAADDEVDVLIKWNGAVLFKRAFDILKVGVSDG